MTYIAKDAMQNHLELMDTGLVVVLRFFSVLTRNYYVIILEFWILCTHSITLLYYLVNHAKLKFVSIIPYRETSINDRPTLAINTTSIRGAHGGKDTCPRCGGIENEDKESEQFHVADSNINILVNDIILSYKSSKNNQLKKSFTEFHCIICFRYSFSCGKDAIKRKRLP